MKKSVLLVIIVGALALSILDEAIGTQMSVLGISFWAAVVHKVGFMSWGATLFAVLRS